MKPIKVTESGLGARIGVMLYVYDTSGQIDRFYKNVEDVKKYKNGLVYLINSDLAKNKYITDAKRYRKMKEVEKVKIYISRYYGAGRAYDSKWEIS